MKQMSSEARKVLELARLEDGPDASAASRVERSLAKRIALGGAVMGGSVLAKSAAASGLWATLGKSAVAAGAAAGIALAGWEAAHSDSPSEAQEPPSRPASVERHRARVAMPPPLAPRVEPEREASPTDEAPRPQPEPKSETMPVAMPAAEPKTRTMTSTPEQGPSPQPLWQEEGPPSDAPVTSKPEPDQLALETRELREAQQALRNGDAGRALGLLEAQERRYAAGVLTQERQAARVLALCQSGQVQRARDEAKRFERQFPQSALRGKVKNACSE